MKDQKNEKVLNKIKNLLDLSTSDNEHESALALSKARELMDKYGVEESDLVMSNIKECNSFAFRGQKAPMYLLGLAAGIGELFNCKFYNIKTSKWDKGRWKNENEFVFVGFAPNHQIASYCYDVLSEKLKRARKSYLFSLSPSAYRTKRADAYAYGWSKAIFRKVREMVPRKEETGVGLIPVDMLEQYVINVTVGELKEKPLKRLHRDEMRGLEDGEKVDINKGMEYRPKTMIG